MSQPVLEKGFLMQPKLSPLLLATAGLGVLALGGLAFVFLQPGGSAPAPGEAQNAAPTPTPTPAMRWVAARDIPPRTRLTPDMLAKVPYQGKPTEGAIADITDVRGEITNEPISRGEAVTLASFTPGIKRVVPANIEIPRGFRAVAIYVDPNSTAAGLVDVGDYVDVIAVHRLTLEKDKNQLVQGASQFSSGRLIGSDLKVLAVDKSLAAPPVTPTPVPAQEGQPAENAPPPTPTPPPAATADAGAVSKTRVLLAAPVEIATRLIAAGDQGTLHITIRNPSDGDQTASPEVREYPSRLITQKDVSTQARNLGKSMGAGMREGLGNTPPMGAVPTFGMMPTPAPPAPMTVIEPPGRNGAFPAPAVAPSGPATTDITVIRGTEKTRVVVPQRGQ
ncbi:Flp pilus assembly protein CpaB [bacterium]|nr:MAG: Flp pilus assembly protein CpaB [bacterium]